MQTKQQHRTNWTAAEIRAHLVNPVVIERAILNLHQRQTESERYSHMTQDSNGVGWNGVDAPFMTSLAEQLLEHQRRPATERGNRRYAEGDRLSPKQRERAAKILYKYAGQLARIANGEI